MKFSKKIKLMIYSFNAHIILMGFGRAVIYFIQKHIIRQKELKLKLNGYPVPVYLRNNTSDIRVFGQLFVSREYENAIKGIDPKIILDCGANIGLASVYFKYHFPLARIYSFEPELSNFCMLKKNVSAYGDIRIFQKAIWYETTKLNLITHASHDSFAVGINGILPGETEIDAISINDFLKELHIGSVDLLKIDSEGAEFPLFNNKTEWISSVNSMIIEIHENINPGSTGFICNLMSKDFLKSESGEYLKFERISSI